MEIDLAFGPEEAGERPRVVIEAIMINPMIEEMRIPPVSPSLPLPLGLPQCRHHQAELEQLAKVLAGLTPVAWLLCEFHGFYPSNEGP